MRFPLLAALVALLISLQSPARGVLVSTYSPEVTHYANRLNNFFARNNCEGKPCGRRDWVLKYTAEQVKWLRFFNIRAETKYLAAIVQESWFNPRAVGTSGELGVTQVYSVKLADRVLRKRGINPKRLTPIQLQAARGAAVFKVKLRAAGGDPWRGIELYNGSGPQAQKHRARVWRLHRDIFG